MTITVSVFDKTEHLHGTVLYGQSTQRSTPGDYAGCVYFTITDLVLYQLTTTRRRQTFLFRGCGLVSVPGVTPAVNLIAHATNSIQSRKLVRSVLWLADRGFAPDSLSDSLWLRISGLLNQENYGVRHLRRLLETRA